MNKNSIAIRGANHNNLKNLDVDLQLNKITVITGVSGSGKSSLAFNTIYAEGQRRYIESFSAYTRQFMDRMDKPDVKSIDGILPSIAICQTNPIKSSRSTLGTFTEINDYVKLLFSKAAKLYCGKCGKHVEKDSSSSIANKLLLEFTASPCVITFPFSANTSERILPEEIAKGLRQQGFNRAYHSGKTENISAKLILLYSDSHLNILTDQIIVSQKNRKRLVDSIETAIKFGKGLITVFFPEKTNQELKLSTALHCPHCNIKYSRSSPNLFSFNSPLGACGHCNGFGRTIEVDISAVIPDTGLTLRQDAVKPWSTPS